MDFREINDNKTWENFIFKQNFTSPFQSWSWGEFEKSMGNTFERIGMFQEGKLVGVLPIKKVYAKRGNYLHLRHGPVFKYEDQTLWSEFLHYIKEKARNEKFSFIRISPLIPKESLIAASNVITSFKESSMHDVDAEITWVLGVTPPADTLLKNMRKNTRYAIRRASRDGVKVLKTQDVHYLPHFWKIYQDTVQRQQWTAYSYEYIKTEFKILKKENRIDLFLARYKDIFIAGSLIIYFGNQAIYHHSGTLTKYAKIPASYAIQWQAIQEAKKRGLSWYNFWGISPLEGENNLKPRSGHPWEGLTFFKMGFGGKKREFIHAKDIVVSPKYYITHFFERWEKWRRGY
jgi:peptidoglycan pentaglycine glycine transferase (the first glycine)